MNNTIFGGTTATPVPIVNVDQTFYTESTNAQSGKSVAEAISKIAVEGTIKFTIVNELPETGEKGTIYLVGSTASQTNNLYDEYIYTNATWEKIGSTRLEADLTDKVDKISRANVTNTNNYSYQKAQVPYFYGVYADAEGVEQQGLIKGSITTVNTDWAQRAEKEGNTEAAA